MRFLIADIKLPADLPAERWFWFDPPFNPGQSALLHQQPDDLWRIDLQLGPEADPAPERGPARVRPRLEAMLGKEASGGARPPRPPRVVRSSSSESASTVPNASRSALSTARYLRGQLGAPGLALRARGTSDSSVQDIDNLAWKLAAVLTRPLS